VHVLELLLSNYEMSFNETTTVQSVLQLQHTHNSTEIVVCDIFFQLSGLEQVQVMKPNASTPVIPPPLSSVLFKENYTRPLN
jgi:hypothetical protein